MFAAMGVESGVVRGYSVYTLGVQCGGVGDFWGNSGDSDLELDVRKLERSRWNGN